MQNQGTVRDEIKEIICPLTRNLTEMLLKTANGISENVPKEIRFFFSKREVQEVQVSKT